MTQLIEVLAVSAGAVYGVLLARRHGMDPVGVLSLAFVVAFGGGTSRDVLLGRFPLFWVRESRYAVIVFAVAAAACLVPRLRIREGWLTVPDALGLGLFSLVGATAAAEAGASLLVACLLGVVTGTFGGVIGEVICNQVPSLFRTAPLYATCSFAGCWVFFGLTALGLGADASTAVAAGFIVVFRLLAVRHGWTLPQLPPAEE